MKLACKQALHLGEIVKSRSARRDAKAWVGEQTRPQGAFRKPGKSALGTRFGGLRDSFPHGQASYPRASKSLYLF